jgi:hypothetical protein
VPEDTVHEVVGSVHHRFDDVPIRDFVPLFAESLGSISVAGELGAPSVCTVQPLTSTVVSSSAAALGAIASAIIPAVTAAPPANPTPVL